MFLDDVVLCLDFLLSLLEDIVSHSQVRLEALRVLVMALTHVADHLLILRRMHSFVVSLGFREEARRKADSS
jgi:hypothetical protein